MARGNEVGGEDVGRATAQCDRGSACRNPAGLATRLSSDATRRSGVCSYCVGQPARRDPAVFRAAPGPDGQHAIALDMLLPPTEVPALAREVADLSFPAPAAAAEPPELRQALAAIEGAGGRAMLVGGSVRDLLCGAPSKDYDFEVYGLSAEAVMRAVAPFGHVYETGVSFGVIKFHPGGSSVAVDLSLPRRERSTGAGHRDFEVVCDPSMSVAEAALRRDFTVNAMYLDAHSGEFLDPLGGAADLEAKVLRASSPAFAEDPLRVLRGFQMAARFGMHGEDGTLALCRSLRPAYQTLAKERVWVEWEKWAEKGRFPSMGLKFLDESGWLSLYPELSAMKGVEQDPRWHPEGDVWVHTGHVCDEALVVADREGLTGDDRLVLMFSALCHDVGKPATTKLEDGQWKAKGHCEEGVEVARSFLEKIGCPLRVTERVLPLVKEHLAHANRDKVTTRIVSRLARRLVPATIRELVMLIEADVSGRPPLPRCLPKEVSDLLRVAEAANVTTGAPKPLVLGRHLIALGMKPGPGFKSILDRVYEMQLDCAFASEEEGVVALKGLLEQKVD